jgi:PAS domain S-box-containing protein
MLRMVSRCNRALVHAQDEASLAREICSIITSVGGYRLAWVGMVEEGPQKRVVPIAHSGFEKGYLEKAKISWDKSPSGRGPTGTAIRTRKPSIARDILNDLRFAPWRRDALGRGYSSSIALPIIVGCKAVGALNIYSSKPDAFKPGETGLLMELAHDLAFGIKSVRAASALRESESRFRELFQKSRDGVLVADVRSKRIYFANSIMCRLLGYSAAELLTLKIPDLHKKSSLRRVMADFTDLAEGKKLVSHDIPFLRKDGSVVMAKARASRTCLGEKQCLVGFFTDTSEQQRMLAELGESRALYQSVFRNTHSCIVAYAAMDAGKDFIIADINPAAERTEKVRGREVIGKLLTHVFPGVKEYGILEVFRRVWKTGKPETFPAKIYRDERIVGWRENYVFKLDSGNIVAIYSDLTSEKQAEERFRIAHEALEESEEKFRTLANSSLQGIIIVSGIPLHIEYANSAMADLAGYTLEEFLALRPDELASLIHPDDRNTFFSTYRTRLRGRGAPSRYMIRAVRKDGKPLWLEISSNRIFFGGKPAVQATFVDRTAHMEAEVRLKESEERFRKLFEESSIGMALVGLDGRFQKVNHALCRMLGYEDKYLTSRTFADITHPSERERDIAAARAISEGKQAVITWRRGISAATATTCGLQSTSPPSMTKPARRSTT